MWWKDKKETDNWLLCGEHFSNYITFYLLCVLICKISRFYFYSLIYLKILQPQAAMEQNQAQQQIPAPAQGKVRAAPCFHPKQRHGEVSLRTGCAQDQFPYQFLVSCSRSKALSVANHKAVCLSCNILAHSKTCCTPPPETQPDLRKYRCLPKINPPVFRSKLVSFLQRSSVPFAAACVTSELRWFL